MKFSHSLRALRHSNFRLYFSGQVVSLIGTWMQNVAMSWLAYRLGNLVWLLGAISFFQQIPMLLLAPFSGALLDRIDRLRLLRVTQTLSMIPAFTAAFLTFSGLVQVWHLMVLAGLLGIINAIDVPARQSLIVTLIDDREALPNAIAMNSLAVNSARLVGPALGGLVVAALGEGMCFFINGVSYLAVVAALFCVHNERAQAPAGTGRAGVREGWRYAAHSPAILTLLGLVSISSLLVAPYIVIMPFYARDVFGGDSKVLGLLLGCSGVGALIASFFMLSRPHVHALIGALRWSVPGAALGVMAFSYCHWIALSAMFTIVMGFGMIITASTCNTVIQAIVHDDMRGRVMALFSSCFIGLAPVGNLAVSSIAHYVGVPATLMGAGIAAMGLALWASRGLVVVELALSNHGPA